jgi:hypothetical protein
LSSDPLHSSPRRSLLLLHKVERKRRRRQRIQRNERCVRHAQHLQPEPLCPPTLAGVVAGVPAVLSIASLPIGFALGRRGHGSHVVRAVGRVVGCGVVLLVAPPLAPALPALVVEFARAGPVSLYSAPVMHIINVIVISL